MHGYLSRDGMPPAEFLDECRAQLKRYPTITLLHEEVTDVERFEGGFEATLATGKVYRGRKLLLATGLVDELPPIEGLRERWGSSVFPCPFCDGWEYRGRPMAVYGTGTSASCAFTLEMLTWSRELVLLTDGSDDDDPREVARLNRLGVRVERRRIQKLEGPGRELQQILLADGSRFPCEALFVMTSQHQRAGFAEKLGAHLTEDATVPTGPLQHTRVRGVYAAGNASVGLQAAILAAAEGFKAAYAINDELVEDWAAQQLGERPSAEGGHR